MQDGPSGPEGISSDEERFERSGRLETRLELLALRVGAFAAESRGGTSLDSSVTLVLT